MAARRHLRFAIFTTLLSCATSCWARPVTVRVIDIHSGHPLEKEEVKFKLLYDKGQETSAPSGPNFSGETDAKGEVHFEIAEPLAAHFSVMVHLKSEYVRCGCWVLGSTQDLIQNGVVGPPPGGKSEKSNAALIPGPGEVLVKASPMQFFERLLYPLVKE